MTDPVPSAGGTGAGQTGQQESQQNQATGKTAEEKANKKTIIIGLSGPSSSGKTTLARLLRTIFSVNDGRVRSFIIHEDDFYFPDDKIPVTRTKSGDLVQDWDTIGAIDVPFLSAALAYVRQNGELPPRLKSKEDQNQASDPGVDPAQIASLQREVGERLIKKQEELNNAAEAETGPSLTVAFLEGFLLYAPPESEAPQHVLRPIHNNIHLHLFLPAPYDLVKTRREARSGYVTIGPGPTPSKKLPDNEQTQQQEQQQLQRQQEEQGHSWPQDTSAVDLEKGDHPKPQQNFWTDPPGYVEDIVWPRYVQDHAWLLLPEDDGQDNQKPLSLVAQERSKISNTPPEEELLKLVGQGTNLRTDAGVTIAPGKGKLHITELLDWAVGEILKCLEVEGKA
ncbi:hypothetical protein VTN77DRAFT_8947 [Rasamsonia byssochlamydoides]|uniref:uncharacterized protein n=1 Tax=Rasamsonia byssochlamydoides TaxID=89139 RepID=UPI003743AC68